jgi:Ca-activated chloride channel family protein
MRLAEPLWLLLLPLIPLLMWAGSRRRPRLAWPTLAPFEGAPRGRAGLAGIVPPLLRFLALSALVVALARPQTVGGRTRLRTQGIAIVVALDRSSSMEAADGRDPLTGRPVTRFDSAREAFARFVAGRTDDLVGLVAFAAAPDLTSPPTLDHEFLLDAAGALRTATAAEDGTNIGDAIAWGLDALRHAGSPRKVLVVLTDGDNRPPVTAGAPPLDPRAAARLASRLGITLHSVAVGRAGGTVRETIPGVNLDLVGEVEGPNLELLRDLARLGNGRAFEAADPAALAGVFAELDAFERTSLTGAIRTRYREWAPLCLAVAIAAILFDRLLAAGPLRRLP